MSGINGSPILNYQHANDDYARKGSLSVFDVVISHYGCHDGISAAWVIYDHQRDIKKPKFIFIRPDQKLTKAEIRYLYKKRVILVDVCFTTNFANFLKEKVCEELVILDHHLGVADNVINYEDGIFDNNRCGAMMAWHYFYGVSFPQEFSQFNPLRYIDAYDRFTNDWKQNIGKTQEIFEGMRIYGAFSGVTDFDEFINEVKTNPTQMKTKIIEMGSVVTKMRDIAIRDADRKKTHMVYHNPDGVEYKVIMVSIDPQYRSQAGSEIASKNLDSVVVIYRYDPNEDCWIMSARSNENSQVSALQLAQEFGGSGHQLAAGFTIYGARKFTEIFKSREEELIDEEIGEIDI